MLAYVAIFAGAALIALATGLAFAGVLRAITVGSRQTVPPRRQMVPPGHPTAPPGHLTVPPERQTAPARRPAPQPARLDDYGLLRTVILVESLDIGGSFRDLLTAGGVRATIASGTDGLIRVLVFPRQYEQARLMVSWAL